MSEGELSGRARITDRASFGLSFHYCRSDYLHSASVVRMTASTTDVDLSYYRALHAHYVDKFVGEMGDRLKEDKTLKKNAVTSDAVGKAAKGWSSLTKVGWTLRKRETLWEKAKLEVARAKNKLEQSASSKKLEVAKEAARQAVGKKACYEYVDMPLEGRRAAHYEKLVREAERAVGERTRLAQTVARSSLTSTLAVKKGSLKKKKQALVNSKSASDRASRQLWEAVKELSRKAADAALEH